MRAVRDAGARNAMVLRLERAGGMDDDVRRNPGERFFKIAVDIERMRLGRVRRCKRIDIKAAALSADRPPISSLMSASPAKLCAI